MNRKTLRTKYNVVSYTSNITLSNGNGNISLRNYYLGMYRAEMSVNASHVFSNVVDLRFACEDTMCAAAQTLLLAMNFQIKNYTAILKVLITTFLTSFRRLFRSGPQLHSRNSRPTTMYGTEVCPVVHSTFFLLHRSIQSAEKQ